MKIVIVNYSGNTGKTTLARHLLVPQIPNAKRISIEDMNAGDGTPDLEIGAKLFRAFAAELNVADDRQNFVVDIGASNARAMVEQFSSLSSTRDDIDYWIVPVTHQVKQRTDTLTTVEALMGIDVVPSRIIVLPNNISDIEQFQGDFEKIAAAAEDEGFILCEQAVLSNEIFDLVKNDQKSVFDIASDTTDFRTLRADLKSDESGLRELGIAMVLRDVARFACNNLRQVFAALPLTQSFKE